MPTAATLAGMTALVTGAARRIGRATALALAGAGVNVVVHYRSSRDEAESVAAEVTAQHVKAWTLAADLADANRAAGLIDEAVRIAGPVDILVNNASVFPPSRLEDVTVDDITQTVQVNALSPFLLARAFAAQGRAGSVVNFLDTRIVAADPDHVAYLLSKRMLYTLTRTMALEFAPRVRVNAVAPGLILPPPGGDESYLAQLAASNPLHTHGSVHDVTRAVLFLLESPFVTGQVVFVDGGSHVKESPYGYG